MDDRVSSRQLFLLIAWLIAFSAMALSLYGSEVLRYPVCSLCWYQRISLYSLAIILGIAAYRGDANISPYAITLAMIGGAFALYHYLEQMIPGFQPIDFCSAASTTSCTLIHIRYFGFITYPLLSLCACLCISLCCWLAQRR